MATCSSHSRTLQSLDTDAYWVHLQHGHQSNYKGEMSYLPLYTSSPCIETLTTYKSLKGLERIECNSLDSWGQICDRDNGKSRRTRCQSLEQTSHNSCAKGQRIGDGKSDVCGEKHEQSDIHWERNTCRGSKSLPTQVCLEIITQTLQQKKISVQEPNLKDNRQATRNQVWCIGNLQRCQFLPRFRVTSMCNTSIWNTWHQIVD